MGIVDAIGIVNGYTKVEHQVDYKYLIQVTLKPMRGIRRAWRVPDTPFSEKIEV